MNTQATASTLALALSALSASAQTIVDAATWTQGGGVAQSIGLFDANSGAGQTFVSHGSGELQTVSLRLYVGSRLVPITMTVSSLTPDGLPGATLGQVTLQWFSVALSPTRPIVAFDFASQHIPLTDGQAYAYTLSVAAGGSPEAYDVLADGGAGYAEGTGLGGYGGTYFAIPGFDHLFTVTIAVPTPPACPVDFNQDSDLNADDLSDYITCYFSVPPCDRADFNADGDVNPDDLGDFITTYFGSAC